MKYALIISLIFNIFQSIACQCADEKKLIEAQMDEFNNSTLIIIGNVIEISENQRLVTVVVEEVLKGELIENDTVVYENNFYCEPFVDNLGNWLFYGSLDNGVGRINECGLSRSLKFPERNRYFMLFPAPPVPGEEVGDEKTLEEEKKKGIEKARQFALKELGREIADLRSRKK